MMASGIRRTAPIALFFSMVFQAPTHALTNYVASGTFIGGFLEVIEGFDENTGNPILVDAFPDSPPFGYPVTYSLTFTVDESVDGSVSLFSETASFDDAVSNISLNINGASIFNSSAEVATVRQFRGDTQDDIPARWSWDFSPEIDSFSLPDILAIDNDTSESLGTATARSFSFKLFDSSRQIYTGNGVSFLDMITLDPDKFDGTSLQIFWSNDSGEEPEHGEEPPEINYTAFATVDNLANLSAVPIPGGIWLFLSALSGFFVVTRRNA